LIQDSILSNYHSRIN